MIHERSFLGDMDSKDGDYRRILYAPHKKTESVSACADGNASAEAKSLDL